MQSLGSAVLIDAAGRRRRGGAAGRAGGGGAGADLSVTVRGASGSAVRRAK